MRTLGDAQPQQLGMLDSGEHGDDDVAGADRVRERLETQRGRRGAILEPKPAQALTSLVVATCPQDEAISSITENPDPTAGGQAAADPVDGSACREGFSHEWPPI